VSEPTERTGAADTVPVPVALPWLSLVGDDVPTMRPKPLPHPRRMLLQLGLTALAVFALVAAGTSVAARSLAEREAVNDAAHATNLMALAIVQPALQSSLLDGDQVAYAALDEVVRENVLPNGIVRVKLWSPDGTVVYADEERLVGQRFPLGREQLEALATPETRAEVSDLDRSENEFERYGGKLLEVYRPVWTPDGKELLFEVYGDYAPVQERASELWRGLTGLLATSLLLLLVLMAPILWRVLDRLRAAQEQRESLLRRALDASDSERRRIAADLHDGPVQDLVASSLVVSGAAERARVTGRPDLADDAAEAATAVRASVASLRSLLVDIYPDQLTSAALPDVMADLTRPLAGRGVQVDLDIDAGAAADLAEDEQLLAYRVTREALRNVVKHASASGVTIRLVRDDLELRHPVHLSIEDDGVGFVADEGRSREGHFGLLVLTDLARDAGATLHLATAPGRGTHWRLGLPAHGRRRRASGAGS
jgi:signal transduction histidine kinase